MNWKKWTGGATFWKTLPAPSLIIFLAGVSDGFTETFDVRGREFGMAGIEEIIRDARSQGLREISTELRAQVLAHGEQRDDQTVLLVRRLA